MGYKDTNATDVYNNGSQALVIDVKHLLPRASVNTRNTRKHSKVDFHILYCS